MAAVKAVVFDLYGTMLAIESMRDRVAAVGIADADAFVTQWRAKQLEYAFISSLAGAYRDFDELTALALRQVCTARRVTLDDAAQTRLAAEWQTMPAYPDVAPALNELALRSIPRAVLTNGTPSSASTALTAAGLVNLVDVVLSVDAVRVFKPDQRIYELVTERFACAPGEIVFVSSNAWDAWGAALFGFRVAWCNRLGRAPETLTPSPEVELRGLDELASFV